MPSWSKVTSSKTFTKDIAKVYTRSPMNFGSDTILSKSPNFMHFGLPYVNTTDELRYFFIPITRSVSPTDGSNWLLSSHDISEATADRVSGTKAKNQYNFKIEFETRREKMEDQDFGRKNNCMSRPTLDSTPLGTNTTNGTTSHIDLIPARTKTPEPTPLALPTNLPGGRDVHPSLSDSSRKYNLSNDTNSSISKKKKRDKKQSIRNTRKITRMTQHQVTILIRPTIVITDANNVRGRAIRKISNKIMRTFNCKVADDSI